MLSWKVIIQASFALAGGVVHPKVPVSSFTQGACTFWLYTPQPLTFKYKKTTQNLKVKQNQAWRC